MNKKIKYLDGIRVSLFALFFLAVLIIPNLAFASINGLPLVPFVVGETQSNPRIYGSNVVYLYNNGPVTGLALVNTVSKDQATISSNSNTTGGEINYDISGTKVAYSFGGFVYLYDINTGATTKIPNPQITQADTVSSNDPSIDGNYVTFNTSWTATGQSGVTLTLYNIATGETKQITKVEATGQFKPFFFRPRISGDKVVYESSINNKPGDLYLYDIPLGQSNKIGIGNGFSPRIYGDYVIWTGTEGTNPLIIYQISTQTQKVTGVGVGMGGEIYGNAIVYWSTVDRKVHLYNISSGKEIVGFGDGGGVTGPDIYEGMVVWADNRNSPYNSPTQQTNIYYASLPVNANGEVVESLPCTSWTYSDWSSCSSGGNQTRSINSSSPNSCTGGSPILNQSCTYVPPVPVCTSSDWSCSNWDTCSQNSNQSRSCDKISNCQGGVSSPIISQSCTYVAPIPSCVSFNYSKWSECSSDGKQTRNITSKNPSNCEGGELPKTSQSCAYIPPAPACDADTWTCGEWNSCSLSGIQNRSCRKTFDCSSVETAPPSISEYCTPPNLEKYQISPADQQVVNQNNIIKATVLLWCPLNEEWYMTGSGTVIDSSGTILTNKHVIADTKGCLVKFVDSYKDEPYFNDRQIADIIKISTDADIAILKLRNPSKKVLTYVDITRGNSDILSLGDKISTYGYPTKFGSKITSTRGEFSGVEGDFLKTTAIIDKGNSGGGAYLQDGSFVGIPTKVFSGTFNVLGGILSVNKVKNWLSGAPMTYNDKSYNEYSRVSSVLENIDLKKLDTLKLFISDTDAKGNNITPIIAPTTGQNTQKTTEQPKINQTQKESTVITPVDAKDTNQKINQTQNNSVSSKNESIEKQNKEDEKTKVKEEDISDVKTSEQKRSIVADTVQEIIKVADGNANVGQQIKTIAQTQTQNQEKVETSMQKIQSINGFAKFFVGPNYGEIKNSQKLLEQNKQQIQKLSQLGTQLSKKVDQEKISGQIKILEQENQQMETSLNETKKGFSLFGWTFRLFAK